MHKPSNRVQMVANHHPPKALPMSELINIDHFQYILNTLFFFYFLWYPFSVLHLNVAIIGCLRMRFGQRDDFSIIRDLNYSQQLLKPKMLMLFHAICVIFMELSTPVWQKEVRQITYQVFEAMQEADNT